MEVTAFIIELSAEVVKGMQGGNECWTMNNGKMRGDGRRDGGEAIPPVVARIFSGDSTSPLTRDGHGCPKLNAQSFKHGCLKSAT
mgnify:CR=1 FL=1